MKTLTVNIDDTLSEKAITSVLDALKLEYGIEDDALYKDETERIMANSYLADKINHGIKEMKEGKGTKISIDDLWK